MKRNIVLMGYGMQGKACVYDLLRFGAFDELHIVDCYETLPEEVRGLGDPRLTAHRLDGNDQHAISELMQSCSLVIDFLPPHMTLQTVELAVANNCHAITSSYLENPAYMNRPGYSERLEGLQTTALKNDRIILEEFGMDPGIDLVMAQQALAPFKEVHALHSYGAGFPEYSAANNPLKYKFSWSIIGVIRSHLRPATIIEDGIIRKIPGDRIFAEENMHHLDLAAFEEPLECFANGNAERYIDLFGIGRTVKSMGRYICRWPGHGAFWSRMGQCGFISDTPIKVGDHMVKPEEFCASLLGSQPQFFYQEGERDVALLRVDARGRIGDKLQKRTIQTICYRNLESGFSAMQQTVGFPMAIGSMMILDNAITKRGRTMPTEVPQNTYLEELARRGITFTTSTEAWDGTLTP